MAIKKMNHSTIIEADVDTVWAEIRDIVKLVNILFGNAIENVHWTDGAVERVPARYEFTLLPSKEVVRQEIAGRNEIDRTVTYRSIGPAICIYDYVATYRVQPLTNDPGRSFLEWTREFKIIEGSHPEIVEALLSIMENQINTVRDHFAAQGELQQAS